MSLLFYICFSTFMNNAFPKKKRAFVTTAERKHPRLDDGDYYYSDQGVIVFTTAYHLKRGYCCKSACRHCPYDFKKS